MILHLVSKADWDALPASQPYRAATLDTEGFIHATKGETMLLQVANAFYKSQPGEFYVLHIDESKLTSEVKWEAAADPAADPVVEDKNIGRQQDKEKALPPEAKAEFGEEAPPSISTSAPPLQFPHIYGPINREAIVGMRLFTRSEDGTFTGFAQIDDNDVADSDPSNPLNVKTPSQMADELLQATDDFSDALSRFKDRVEGRMAEIDEKIKKL